MGAWQVGTAALPTGTGAHTVAHGITGLTANPPAGNALAALLADTDPTVATTGLTITAVGSTTISFSKTTTHAQTVGFLIGVGVRAVQF